MADGYVRELSRGTDIFPKAAWLYACVVDLHLSNLDVIIMLMYANLKFLLREPSTPKFIVATPAHGLRWVNNQIKLEPVRELSWRRNVTINMGTGLFAGAGLCEGKIHAAVIVAKFPDLVSSCTTPTRNSH
jgi:hypothetical protein